MDGMPPRPLLALAAAFLLAALGCSAVRGDDAASPARAPAPGSPTRLRVYHVGNSVTDMVNYKAFQKMVASRGNTYTYGRHMMPGTPLFGLWDNQDKGFTEAPYGASRQALTGYEWDVITLQPFDRLLEGGREHEFETCSRFIDLAIARSPDAQIYVYQRWPKLVAVAGSSPETYQPFDYSATWKRKYSGNWDTSYETHDFFDRLVAKLNKSFGDRLKKPVKVIPVGDVMAELDQRIKAGEVEGIKKIEELYADTVHLNDAGRYLVGVTFYATLYGDDPKGLPTREYGEVAPAVAKAIQAAAAKVVKAAEQGAKAASDE